MVVAMILENIILLLIIIAMEDGGDPDKYLRVISNYHKRKAQLIKNKCNPEQIAKYLLSL